MCAAKAQEKGDQMTHHFLKLKRSRLNDCWPSYGRGLSSGRQRWLGALRSRVMMPTGRESCESKLECLLVELYWFREHSFLASLNPRWGLISPPPPPVFTGLAGVHKVSVMATSFVTLGGVLIVLA